MNFLNPNHKLCDLHIHSTFSDSDSTIEQIFTKAKEKSLCCISLTDHDTISGVNQALSLSKEFGIECIPGVELSAQREGEEVHILGYFIDQDNKDLARILEQIKESRYTRLELMVEKLNSIGIKINKEEVLSINPTGVPTRLQLGVCLMQKGIVKTLVEAFKKYLTPGRPAYVSRFKITVEDTVDIIYKSGGLAFLAHPYLLVNQNLVKDIAALTKIDGIEFNYSNLSEAKKIMYTKIIEENNLLKSGGSDAHGSYKKYTDIGAVTVPYEWVIEMKKRIGDRAKAHSG